MLLSPAIKQLENFAGVMNFVIFPVFFMSSALYPLWKMRESSELLYYLCAWNPFTHAVELIRHALYGGLDFAALGWTALALAAFLAAAIHGYNPARGMMPRKGGGGVSEQAHEARRADRAKAERSASATLRLPIAARRSHRAVVSPLPQPGFASGDPG